MEQRVNMQIRDGIAIVTMNRPDKLNGLDYEMFVELVAAARRLRRAREVRAVILRGEGRAFCAGLDFQSFGRQRGRMLTSFIKWGFARTNLFQRAAWCWRELPVPVIAVIHGACYGGGMQIALAADFRIAAPDADLSIMEMKWGLIPDMTGSVSLRELLPMDQALRLTMTAERLSGVRARELGLVTEVAEDPFAAAQALASQIAQRSPDAIAQAKRLFQRSWTASVRRAFRIESALQLRLLLGRNHAEAVRANRERRAPSFAPRTL